MNIRESKPGQVLNDTQVTGLHLRHLRSGRRVFMLYYRTKAGVQRRPKLGDHPTLSLSEARRVARDLLARVAVGEDPREKWDQSRAELTVTELFNQAWEGYWASPVNKDRFERSGWARDVKYHFQNHLEPAFGSLKLSAVTPPDIRAWHRKLALTAPYAANRALEVLSRMFTFAEEEGLKSVNTNPCSLVKGVTEKKRERVATNEEIQKIGAILAREVKLNPREAVFIMTLMFSGARPKSLERALKSELTRTQIEDEEWGQLIFAGKTTEVTGEDERVMIPPHILKLIDELPPHESPRLFGIRMPTAFWNQVKDEAGIEDLWIRDWRRTFASTGLSAGVILDHIGETMNHRHTQTTKGYAKLSLEKRVQTVATVSERYQKLIGGVK